MSRSFEVIALLESKRGQRGGMGRLERKPHRNVQSRLPSARGRVDARAHLQEDLGASDLARAHGHVQGGLPRPFERGAQRRRGEQQRAQLERFSAQDVVDDDVEVGRDGGAWLALRLRPRGSDCDWHFLGESRRLEQRGEAGRHQLQGGGSAVSRSEVPVLRSWRVPK